MSGYAEFLATKRIFDPPSGFDVSEKVISKRYPRLFPFQRDIVSWACQRGRGAVFADTGLGKTAVQLAWAAEVVRETGGAVLILAPLAVGAQTVREGVELGVKVTQCREVDDVAPGVNVTNYERLERFTGMEWSGVVLDESSILKGFDGKTRRRLTEWGKNIPFRICCTATPAPNDIVELGNHAEFLGAMTADEMMALYFTQDGNSTQKWRMKGHARKDFWMWLASWALAIRRPSDMGHDDEAYRLPRLDMRQVTVGANVTEAGRLFGVEAQTLMERRAARRESVEARVAMTAATVLAEPDQPWLVWCDLNAESAALVKAIPGAVEIKGADSAAWKEMAAVWFMGDKCICAEPEFRAKLRSWKNSNDQTPSTTAFTTRPTNTSGKSALGKSRTSITPPDVPATQATLNTGRRPRHQLEAEASYPAAKPDSKPPSVSHLPSTSLCLPNKEADAPSADSAMRMDAAITSTSITATPKDTSEESSALTATWRLGSSETIQNDSNVPRCICGKESGRRVLVSKSSIFGFGLNFQHCARMAFVGLSDSYEQLYQAVRRCWRFGQKREVHAYVVTSEAEGAVVRNIERKERQAAEMMSELVGHMGSARREMAAPTEYERETRGGSGWTMHLGDSIEVINDVPDESAGLIVFSPPFPGMYVYTDSPRDMGNSATIEELMAQYRYLIPGMLRVLRPGRTCAVHLTQGMDHKSRGGQGGLLDFRGEVIRAMTAEGFIYYGEVTIDKDPQIKAIRTKDRGLLFKSLANDAAHMRMALADYVLQFRKPGDNEEAIRAGVSERYSNADGWITPEEWIEWAAPVWYRASPDYPGGIRETDVLNAAVAREGQDERHLCPLQLGVIERCVKLWSNPGDVVLSPFAGIGSEGVGALKFGRRFVGIELKRSYYETACRNLTTAEGQMDLFAGMDAAS